VAAGSAVAGRHHVGDSEGVQSASMSDLYSSAQSEQNEHSSLPGQAPS